MLPLHSRSFLPTMKKIAPSFDGEKCTAKVRLDRISDERELCHSQNPHFIGGGGMLYCLAPWMQLFFSFPCNVGPMFGLVLNGKLFQ